MTLKDTEIPDLIQELKGKKFIQVQNGSVTYQLKNKCL